MFKSVRAYENLHIALWLFKDICWVSMWRLGGMIMIVPTFLVAVHITWKARKNIHDLFHNIAIVSWICANGIWMAGEFYCDDCTRPYAIAFFSVGISVVTYYYVMIFPKRGGDMTERH